MSNKVSFSAVTQDVTFSDSIATSHADPAYCGARTYTLSPVQTFLTISGTTMNLATSDVADVGVHNVDVIVSLTDYPWVASIKESFVATITCEVQTLTFTTVPAASTTLKYSDSAIDLTFVIS